MANNPRPTHSHSTLLLIIPLLLTLLTPTTPIHIPYTIHNIVPQQIIGLYTLRGTTYPNDVQNCPNKLYISKASIAKTDRSTYYIIEHDEIFTSSPNSDDKDPEVKCTQSKTADGAQIKKSATLLQEAQQYLKSDYPQPPREIVELLASANEEFFVGAEIGDRVCGKHTIPSNTVSVWLAPNRDLLEKRSHVAFKSGEKYVVYVGSKGPSCLYVSKASEQGVYKRPTHKEPVSGGGGAVTQSEGGSSHPSGGGSGGGNRPATVVGGPVVYPGDAPEGLPSPLPTPVEGQSNPTTTTGGGGGGGGGSSGAQMSPLPTSELVVQERGSSTSEGGTCFPGNGKVEVQGKGVVTMDILEVGDYVRVNENTFSEVLLFTHRDINTNNQFLRISAGISTGQNVTLTVSPGHYIYVNDMLQPARNTKTGDTVTLMTGEKSEIENVEEVCARGLYNPQTAHGDIVVNDVVSSTFTTAVRPPVAKLLMIPVKLMRSIGFSFTGWSGVSLERSFDWFRGKNLMAKMVMNSLSA